MTPRASLITALPLVFLALLAAPQAQCAPDNSTLGPAFAMAPAGVTCKAFCKSRGQKDAYFQPYVGNPPKLANATSLCAARIGEEFVSGYQFRDGAPECEVAVGGVTYVEEEYGCACLGQSQTQGMVRADGQGCAVACATSSTQLGSAYQATYGSAASSVSADTQAASYACLPYDNQGRYSYLLFGHLDLPESTCQATYNDAALATESYSCFCIFGKTLADAGLNPQKDGSNVQVASIADSG